jgi:2-haloacid dehalogenase
MTYSTPSVIVFDVNETLSDMSPLKARFVEVGAPAHLARIWFATLLRDGFALAAAGGSAKFAVIGSAILRGFLRDSALSRSLDDAVNHIMDGFGTLSVHPDIAEGIRALKSMEMRLVTLSNGSAQVAEDLLAGAGLRSDFEDLLTVEDAPAWKPVRAAYDYAADVCGVQPGDMLLVAVHPWDIHGAAQAGLRTAWLNRTTEIYPDYFAAPDYTITSLGELATRLADDPVDTTREN